MSDLKCPNCKRYCGLDVDSGDWSILRLEVHTCTNCGALLKVDADSYWDEAAISWSLPKTKKETQKP